MSAARDFMVILLAAALTYSALQPDGPDQDLARLEQSIIAGVLPADQAWQAAARLGLDGSTWPEDQPLTVPRFPSPAEASRIYFGAREATGAAPGELRALEAVIFASHDGTQFGSDLSWLDDALALRALAPMHQDDPRLEGAARLLVEGATEEGWGWGPGAPAGTDETVMVVEALLEYHRTSPDLPGLDQALQRGWNVARLALADGAAATPGVGDNCQSTGLAAYALGLGPANIPLAATMYLATCRAVGGGFASVPGGAYDAWATSEILPGLMGFAGPAPVATH